MRKLSLLAAAVMLAPLSQAELLQVDLSIFGMD